MKSDAKRVTTAVVALVAACSSPDMIESGFISLGRDGTGDGGVAYGGQSAGTGGVFPNGGAGTAGAFPGGGTAGTAIPVGGTTSGDGGTNGGTAGDAIGGASTDGGAPGDPSGGAANTGLIAGNASGGTMGEGGDGPVCGSGGLPTDQGGLETCERVGRVGRICTPFGVRYCGQVYGAVIEQCEPGTCETGCCHETSDPCSILPDGAGCVRDWLGKTACSRRNYKETLGR